MGLDPDRCFPSSTGRLRELANNDVLRSSGCSVHPGDFVRRQPKEAKALTEAWLKGSGLRTAIEEIAKIEVDNDYVAADQDVVVRVLKTYGSKARPPGSGPRSSPASRNQGDWFHRIQRLRPEADRHRRRRPRIIKD